MRINTMPMLASKVNKKKEEAGEQGKTPGGNRGHALFTRTARAFQVPQSPGSSVDLARQAPLNKLPLT